MNPKKVLVVDDSLIVLKVIGMKLKAAGYEVFAEAEGGMAISTARTKRPDLIILDINFPPDVAHGGGVPWDAFTIMTWLGRIEGLDKVPVIIITSSDPAVMKQRCLAAGAIAFFHKPINHEELLQVVRQTIGTPETPATPAT